MTTNTYTCQGTVETVGERVQIITGQQQATRARMQDLREDLRHPHETRLAELDRELAELDGLPDDHVLGRRGCGHDLSEQIAAIPDDGEVYEYRCPACGNTGTVRKAVPVSNELANG